MQEYPIYKHLIQFSTMVDAQGNLAQAPVDTSAPKKEENGKEESGEAMAKKEDTEKEGGEQKDSFTYEGGDSQNGHKDDQIPAAKSDGVHEQEHGQAMNYSQMVQMSSLPPTANPLKWNRNYDNLSSQDRQEMLVDEIFALYLYRMSNRINQYYYKIVLAYVIFFRECLNEYGWGKKIESEGIRLENNPELKLDIETKQFCLVNNAEHAPEICNEFVTVYMEYKKNIFDIPKHDQIDLTINLCHWLFQCQFTCSKLTMIA